MRRRELVLVLAGVAASYPLVARAQRGELTRRIGVVMLYPESDPQGQLRATTFQRQLEKAGWTIGGNLQVNFRWGTGDADWVRSAIREALHQVPDVLLANGDAAALAAHELAKSVPVIFIGSGDPVADGLVQSLAHPGDNVTGFAVMEPSLGSKLLGMLKQVAPRIVRVAILLNPDNATHKRILGLLEASAPNFAVEIEAASAREPTEIETAMTRWGQGSDYGVIVPSDPATNSRRKLFIELAARYRLPTIYSLRAAVADGGLMSYGVDLLELFRQAAIYADRILTGEKASDLPVQLPTKFETVFNLKTAKLLGFDIPASLLATADDVIE
ncbi:MAG: ABC transporter substrate-binding protein [Bradyrhizobium sp.]|uniref:ABC transporter substrate-binding protein n=1 Tax=Bradyrhizobium sp. TaxID=376 RepID=UPI001E0301F6|nr:ABC transporter substrate-binding protein [Bradyrhizobium sp.]MBV9564794.1 ABC transporter substrate-binding protein [Bradyrhizobium sp.]